MFKEYTTQDGKFYPSISGSDILALDEDILYSYDSATSTALQTKTKALVDLLAAPTNQDEIILAYEILYNISLCLTSFTDIVKYLESENLDVSYDSLNKFFESHVNDNDKHMSFAAASIIAAFSIINPIVKFGSIDISLILEKIHWSTAGSDFKGFLDAIEGTLTALGIEIGKVSSSAFLPGAAFLAFIFDNTIFSSNMLYTPANLQKYRIHPQYNMFGDNKTIFQNERYAVEEYNKSLPIILAKYEGTVGDFVLRDYRKDPTYGKTRILIDMWEKMTSTADAQLGAVLSSKRKHIQNSLLYRASTNNVVFQNNEYNKFLQWMLNTNFDSPHKVTIGNDTFIIPNIGTASMYRMLNKFAEEMVNLTDEFNNNINKQIKSAINAISKSYMSIPRAMVDVEITKAKNSLSEAFSLFTKADPVKNKEELDQKKEDLETAKKLRDESQKLIDTLFKLKIRYTDKNSAVTMFYPALTKCIKKFLKKDFELRTFEEWEEMEFLYAVNSVYLHGIGYDENGLSNEDIEKFNELYNTYEKGFRDFKNDTVALINAITSYKSA